MLHESLRGEHRVQPEARYDGLTFARVVACPLDEEYPTAERVTFVLDKLSVYQPAAFYELFLPERAPAYCNALRSSSSPKHRSWVNMAEIEFAASAAPRSAPLRADASGLLLGRVPYAVAGVGRNEK